MKKDTHPTNYREVLFKDVTSGDVFILKSTAETSEKITHEGKEYPLYTVDASSKSHAFYTGNRSSSKSTGRVERFNRMFKQDSKAAKPVKAAKTAEAPKAPAAPKEPEAPKAPEEKK